jgi:hypothetical protein
VPARNGGTDYDGLLADVLAAGSPSPELLARYADDPASLSPQERSELEALLAASPEVADQLRVMQSFDLNAALAEAETRETPPVPIPTRAPARRAPRGPARWTRAWLPAAGVAAAAGFALAVLVMRPSPDPAQSQRVADLELQLEQSRAEVTRLEQALRSASASQEQVAALEERIRALDDEVSALRQQTSPAPGSAPERREQIAAQPTPPPTAPPVVPTPETKPPAPSPQEGVLSEPFVIASNADFMAPNPGEPSTRMLFRSAVPAGAPRVTAWVPAQTGWTTAAQPNLYVQFSEPTSLPIELTLARGDEIVAERSLPPSTRIGVVRISLAELGIRLETGATYQWTLAVRPDLADRSRDIIVGGGIRRVETPALVAAESEKSSPSLRLEELERAGLWYDALDLISAWIEAHPSAENLRAHRRALLSQAGIDPDA